MSTPAANHIIDGPTPKHAQLRDILERLCTEELSVGDPLPSERALEEKYGVSRITVRRAIGDLVSTGRLMRVRGKGTFVAAAPFMSQLHLASFTQEMEQRGLQPASVILTAERGVAPPAVQSAFGTENAEHIHIRRMRLADGVRYSIDDGWYNAGEVDGLLELNISTSVYRLLSEQFNRPITDAEQVCTAVRASADIARNLDIQQGAPVLNIERVSYSHGVPVEYCVTNYASERYALKMRVTQQGTT